MPLCKTVIQSFFVSIKICKKKFSISKRQNVRPSLTSFSTFSHRWVQRNNPKNRSKLPLPLVAPPYRSFFFGPHRFLAPSSRTVAKFFWSFSSRDFSELCHQYCKISKEPKSIERHMKHRKASNDICQKALRNSKRIEYRKPKYWICNEKA